MRRSNKGTPCIICNEWHNGSTLEYKGHPHEDMPGCGNIRILVIGKGKKEYCWRCGCRKSGWIDVRNKIYHDCTDMHCVCHSAEKAS